MKSTRVIAIAGGSGSGKTTLARKVKAAFAHLGCTILGQDSYYFDQSSKFDRDGGAVNFDHPSALEFELLAQHLQELKKGKNVEVPIYDFATHKRLAQTERLEHHPVILVDGTLILSQKVLLPLFDESIFLEVDELTRFERRLKRDVEERGRTPEGVRAQFYGQVKAMHDAFVEPSKQNCTLRIFGTDVFAQNQKDLSSDLHHSLMEIIKKTF